MEMLKSKSHSFHEALSCRRSSHPSMAECFFLRQSDHQIPIPHFSFQSSSNLPELLRLLTNIITVFFKSTCLYHYCLALQNIKELAYVCPSCQALFSYLQKWLTRRCMLWRQNLHQYARHQYSYILIQQINLSNLVCNIHENLWKCIL